MVNWIVFTPSRWSVPRAVRRSHGAIRGSSAVFFVSDAAGRMPVVESTPLHNPHWQYSRNKIACEERLIRAYREQGFR